MTTTEAEHEDLVREWFDVAHAEDWDAMRELVTADFRAHFPPSLGPEPVDIDELIGLLQHFEQAHDIHEVLVEGDRVAARMDANARVVEEFQGLPPSDEEASVPAMFFWRIENGKIAEEWIYEDTLGFMQQLGVIELPDG